MKVPRSYFVIMAAFVLGSASWPVSAAEIRAAKSYKCNAFNPLTGYARIEFATSGAKEKSATVMTYGVFATELGGGQLTYDASSPDSYPQVRFVAKVGGQAVDVHMDLLRPDDQDPEGTVAGVTYVPVQAVIPAWALFTAYPGWSASLGFIAVPVGYVPTSVVTCRISFK